MALNDLTQTGANDRVGREEKKVIASAKMDEILLEAITALEHAKALHETTSNPETKRQAKRILDTLHSSLLKLASFGIHSVKRLERIRRMV